MSAQSFRGRWHASLLVIATVALVLLSAPREAYAQSAVAEALFDEGKAFMEQGKLDEACAKFAASQELEPKPGTLLNLAVCNERRGRLATAYANYNAVAELVERIGQKDREEFARQRAAELESQLCTVTLTVTSPVEGLAVSIDGVKAAALGVALPIDPGRRTITATAPGMKPWSTEIVVPSVKDALMVSIPALEPLPPGPSPAPLPTPTPTPAWPADPPQDTASGGPLWPLVITGFAVTGVGLVAGAITGGIALGKGGDLEDACTEDACPTAQEDALDEANLVANVSNAMFVIAGVGAVVGVVGFFVPTGGDDTSVGVSVGPGSLSLRGTF